MGRALGNRSATLAADAAQAFCAAAPRSSGLSVQVMAPSSAMMPASVARSQKYDDT